MTSNSAAVSCLLSIGKLPEPCGCAANNVCYCVCVFMRWENIFYFIYFELLMLISTMLLLLLFFYGISDMRHVFFFFFSL